jgi:hypothetical protein
VMLNNKTFILMGTEVRPIPSATDIPSFCALVGCVVNRSVYPASRLPVVFFVMLIPFSPQDT